MKQLIIFACIVMHGCIAMEHVPAIIKELPVGVQQYLQSLPKITPPQSDTPEEKSDIIMDYFLQIGGYSNKNIPGREIIRAKILDCIINRRPIVRCMPAFPVATANSDKVPFDDKHCFSMGDLVGLLTRNHISREITKVHAPGSSVALYWEPFIYEINRVCEEELGYPLYSKERIASYQQTLTAMIRLLEPCVQTGRPDAPTLSDLYQRRFGCTPIKIDPSILDTFDREKLHNYEMFWKEDLNSDMWMDRSERILFNQNRADLEKKFPQIRGKSFDIIKTEPVYRKIKSVLGARKHLHYVARRLAEIAFVGSQRVARLMETEIPAYEQQVRESVRPDYMSIQKKIGTPIIYKVEGTPWHKVLIAGAQGIELAPFEKIPAGAKVVYYRIGTHELAYIEKQS